MNPIPRLLLPLPALACVALMLAAADGGEAAPADTRPFIWVQNSEKAGILDKIANHAWASSVFNGMVARVAADVASHQSNRDAFLRELPVEWTLSPAKFKTIPTYAEASVRYAAEQKLNVGVDCAVLYYLTGDGKYASCAADILHNTVKTLLPVAASTSTANGGWIFQNDLLKEARVTGTQLPIVYDFLYPWLQGNQVHDVQTAGMVNFNFTNAQSYFRKYYQLTRDHGQKESNWSALMSTAMLNNLLALDDDSERAAAVQVYLATGSSRQASLNYDYRHYVQAGDIWPSRCSTPLPWATSAAPTWCCWSVTIRRWTCSAVIRTFQRAFRASANCAIPTASRSSSETGRATEPVARFSSMNWSISTRWPAAGRISHHTSDR